jgi:hypothetical protein
VSRWVAPLSLAVVACTAPAPMRIAIPIDSDARSLIAAAEPGMLPGAGTRAPPPSYYAFDRPAPGLVIEVANDRGEVPIEMTVLSFAVPLAEIGLDEGKLDPSANADGVLVGPRAAHLYQSELDGAWKPISTSSLSMTLQNLRGRIGCTSFESEVITLAQDTKGGNSRVLLPIDEASVLAIASGRDGSIGAYRVTVSDPPRVDPVALRDLSSTVAPSWLSIVSGYRLDDGSYLLGGTNWTLRRGRLSSDRSTFDLEAPITTSTTVPQNLTWIAGPTRFEADRVDDLFALTSEGVLARFDGHRFEVLYRFAPFPEGFDGGLVWLGPGRVRAVKDETSVLVVDGSTIGHESVTSAIPPRLSALANLPGIGFLGGVTSGRVFLSAGDGRWTDLGETMTQATVLAFTPYAGGFLFGQGIGGVGQYLSGPGRFCGSPLLASFDVDAMITLGDSVLLGGSGNDGVTGVLLSLIRPRR